MIMPIKRREQIKQIPQDLAEEISAAKSLYSISKKEQSAEFIVAAKTVNEKLRSAGLTALLLVEK